MSGVPTPHGEGQRNRLLAFIPQFIDRHGYPPTIADMSAALDLSRTAVVWHLEMLRDEGKVTYVDGMMARSLQLVQR
jgi:SOS-response transcriptional repressor LexA